MISLISWSKIKCKNKNLDIVLWLIWISLVRFLSSVDPLQIFSCYKSLLTLKAHMISHTSVYLLMYFRFCNSKKTLSTQRAWMWFLLWMNFQVTLQAWSHQKCFSTLITFMQFLSSVDDHVSLKVSLLCETSRTDHMWTVSLQCGSSCESWTLFACQTLSTLITFIQFLSSVDVYVLLSLDDCLKLVPHWSHV